MNEKLKVVLWGDLTYTATVNERMRTVNEGLPLLMTWVREWTRVSDRLPINNHWTRDLKELVSEWMAQSQTILLTLCFHYELHSCCHPHNRPYALKLKKIIARKIWVRLTLALPSSFFCTGSKMIPKEVLSFILYDSYELKSKMFIRCEKTS